MNAQYDAFAEDFSQTRNRPWPEFEILKPEIKKGERILDLGCGNARLRDSLPQNIIAPGAYFGLDLSEKLLNIARKNHPKDHFFQHDFSQKLPFGSDNFEVITAIASFHHLLNKKDQLTLLRECYRVIKPGGKIFLTTWKLPKKYFWKNILKLRFKNWLIPFGKEKCPRIYRRVNDRELTRLLKKAGFSVTLATLFEDRNYIALAQKK